MLYVGIDIATKASYIYVCDEKGKKTDSGSIKTTPEGFERRLKHRVKDGLKIVIEAGNQTRWIHAWLTELGAEVVVVHPAKIKVIAESRKKTDKIDAKLLCDLLYMNMLPEPVHMPSQDCYELRCLLVARAMKLQCRTRINNLARAMLRQDGILLRTRELNTKKSWEALLKRSYKSKHLLPVLQTCYADFLTLTAGIEKLEEELEMRAANDPRVQLLQTMPYVGLISALTLVSAIDDVERFSSGRKLIGYAGLAPTVRQSGEHCKYGSISREGRSEIRAVWIQIAHLVARSEKAEVKPLTDWYAEIAKRRGKKTAVVALARKMLTIAFQMLKTGAEYDPELLKKKAA